MCEKRSEIQADQRENIRSFLGKEILFYNNESAVFKMFDSVYRGKKTKNKNKKTPLVIFFSKFLYIVPSHFLS